MRHGPPLALTQGDPAGIGPEITLKAWLARTTLDLPAFFALADPGLMRRTAQSLGLDVPIREVDPGAALGVFADALPVVPLAADADVMPGTSDAAGAQSTIESIVRAVALTKRGEASAVVTNPIAKHVLYAAGFGHPGHTEYLAALAAHPGFAPPRPVMMLWSDLFAAVPVTVHAPLAAVPAMLTVELIVETADIVARDLRERFGIRHPRLAVAGLNPHAGEAGTIGTEDRDVIAPAVRRLVESGLDVSGPWPADSMFHPAARVRFDAALCMYHDQALIPIKTVAFDDAVNVTLGLPFIRTSPDHGTAFDIAGRGIARPASLIAALRLAGRMVATSARATVPA